VAEMRFYALPWLEQGCKWVDEVEQSKVSLRA
jgi:hypothetical protein